MLRATVPYACGVDPSVDSYRLIEQVVAQHPNLPDGMAALVEHCAQRYPHPIWDETARIDYSSDVNAMQAWFLDQLPIPEPVEVVWFALWDVATGFDLRGSTSWSRDPEDWDWWYHDDFQAGSYESRVLEDMHDLARQVEDPEEGPDVPGGVWELTESLLALGYVSLAAVHVLRSVDVAAVLAGRQERSAVSGFPDAVYGIILGRLTPTGFELFRQT